MSSKIGDFFSYAIKISQSKVMSTALPRKTPKNKGLSIVTLMACIVVMPAVGSNRARAFITEAEKAKNTPAIRNR